MSLGYHSGGRGELPAWLLANAAHPAVAAYIGKGGGKSLGLVPPSAGNKGGGKGLGLVPPSGGNVPAPLRERPTPAWLTAAKTLQPGGLKVSPTASPGFGTGRQRVTPNRISGTLIEWNGTMGFIMPDTPVKHKDYTKNAKGLHLSKADVVPPGHVLSKDMQVTCFAYSDGLKIGAESCMEFKGSSLGSKEKPKEKPVPSKSTGSVKGKGKKAAKGDDGLVGMQTGFKGGQKGIWVFQPQWDKADNRSMKGGGKQKHGGGWKQELGARKQDSKDPRAGKKKGERTRITTLASVSGICKEWKGTHGFIEPAQPIDHPKGHPEGKIYINQKDLIEVLTLYTGQAVNFHIYEDSSGLGAEECIVC